MPGRSRTFIIFKDAPKSGILCGQIAGTSLSNHFVGNNCSGDGNIERIDLAHHRDPDNRIRIVQPEATQPFVLSAYNDGYWLT